MSALVRAGIDVGSTTTKVVAIDVASGALLHSSYRRHHARQAQAVLDILADLQRLFPNDGFQLALTGSGAKALAEALGIPIVQEVVANSLAIRQLHPDTRCAIELGGQDAKMIFLRRGDATGEPVVSDMRMNGSCAGGTGAFIDEIAKLLSIPVEEFDSFAARGTTVHDISGRCGVFAKTDIQPLINQGASKEDIALSTFHAVAKQTIGGLAQGLDIEAPVLLEGGPLTFNATLRRVFAERLGLGEGQVLSPEHPETIVALGTALAIGRLVSPADATVDLGHIQELIERMPSQQADRDLPFFASAEERLAFEERLAKGMGPAPSVPEPGTIDAYLGLDSGSTTTKLALVSEDGTLIHSFYASYGGMPIEVAQRAIVEMFDELAAAGVTPNILGVGTTGYGEDLLAGAFQADVHMVETVAHARATTSYVPDATFLLDIGGQDMKAMWLDHGVVTNVLVNEACSSGCGSFLEGYAANLGIPVAQIEQRAFASPAPAKLGSRCTVFMNSSIIGAQRQGDTPDDIMAGLCRSIIENVFTKVVRIRNTDELGSRIVVQGGTFLNGAVVRALEQRVGHEVIRAPYPGLMGAIGAALLAREHAALTGAPSSFIGIEAVRGLSYTRETNVACTGCANRCARTIITFAGGAAYVTGNRCERGAAAGKVRTKPAANLFDLRQRLLLKDYPTADSVTPRNVTVGIPRVLESWDNLPFWTTLLRSLGVTVRVSGASTQAKFEESLRDVVSDTVCFPAKLVHGHVRELARAGVDRILLPIITTVPSENTSSQSQWMCAVVKGYPMVVRNSCTAGGAIDAALDTPLFHWYDTRDRNRQLVAYLSETFGASAKEARSAILAADAAMASFRGALRDQGARTIAAARDSNTFAIVLAGRPYHNDPLVNHGVARILASMGIPVVPADAVPGIDEVDLSGSRIDVVNNYHARVLSAALIAARSPELELVQLVSFGCGHDAYLADEVARLMRETSGTSPLSLKVDESEATGPLRIRIRSFVETVSRQRHDAVSVPRSLGDPYQTKFERRDHRVRHVLVPNTSHAFCRLLSVAFRHEGLKAVPLDIGRERAIQLGKRYVHNDICFPAQMVVGEILAALEEGRYPHDQVAVFAGRYVGDCRLTHYAALLRKALDDAGYPDVPIVTNDPADGRNMHPGYHMGLRSSAEVALCLPMIDALEALLRRTRPYELVPGSADEAFEKALDALLVGLERGGIPGVCRGFSRAIGIMGELGYERSHPRPCVLIVGEYLLNFHPGANRDIEGFLEANGMEVVEARMTDVIRKSYFYKHAQATEYHVHLPWGQRAFNATADGLFELAHDVCDRIASAHPLYEAPLRMPELVKASDPLIHHTFDAGEGVLIPAEIIHNAEQGCRAFVILQPFGCLPNHVCGRGVAKRLKALYPDAQILPLDFDPDMSQANIENRLQMLIMEAKATSGGTATPDEPGDDDGGGILDDVVKAVDQMGRVAACLY